uniref:Uncharacterized protein n=1 Tax=Siphoviridae sp. ctGFb30 TaxID=2826219 RepID=A0A8S5MGH6_9CAUD|nr:MAG TPA: hypothetical protein [Siphoviridae sp. ctGFb30]
MIPAQKEGCKIASLFSAALAIPPKCTYNRGIETR